MRPLVTSLGLLLVVAPTALGCVADNEAVVFVAPSIEKATLQVKTSAFGVAVAGGFALVLDLGPRASGPSKVTLGAFAITDAAQKQDIVPALPVDAGTVMFPVEVPVDGKVRVDFTFDTSDKALPAEVKQALCTANPPPEELPWIVGTIHDSLQAGSGTPVAGRVTEVLGCTP